jgi:hypothetical protein
MAHSNALGQLRNLRNLKIRRQFDPEVPMFPLEQAEHEEIKRLKSM